MPTMSHGLADSALRLSNPDPTDTQVHPNALFFYPETAESHLFFVVAFGHLLNLTPQGPTAFENGAHVRTMPFHVDTARTDKPPERLTAENLAAIKAAYKLPHETPVTFHVGEGAKKVEDRFAQDLQAYAPVYQQQREADIIAAFGTAADFAGTVRMERPLRVALLFGIDPLPAPTESPLYDSIYKEEPAEVKVYATLWHLLRRPEYAGQLAELAGLSGMAPARVAVHLEPKQDGSWCLGIQRREPLALLGTPPEIAHFHRVAANSDEAAQAGTLLATELRRQFDLAYVPEVFLDRQRLR